MQTMEAHQLDEVLAASRKQVAEAADLAGGVCAVTRRLEETLWEILTQVSRARRSDDAESPASQHIIETGTRAASNLEMQLDTLRRAGRILSELG